MITLQVGTKIKALSNYTGRSVTGRVSRSLVNQAVIVLDTAIEGCTQVRVSKVSGRFFGHQSSEWFVVEV